MGINCHMYMLIKEFPNSCSLSCNVYCWRELVKTLIQFMVNDYLVVFEHNPIVVENSESGIRQGINSE